MSPQPWIAPAQPPLPTARNLPVQFFVGSHSSTLMLESDVGLSTIVTLQCSGISFGGGAFAGGGGPPPGGGVKTPSATVVAAVMLARSSLTLESCSHGMLRPAASAVANRAIMSCPPRCSFSPQPIKHSAKRHRTYWRSEAALPT